jgi:hypothetical protein
MEGRATEETSVGICSEDSKTSPQDGQNRLLADVGTWHLGHRLTV